MVIPEVESLFSRYGFTSALIVGIEVSRPFTARQTVRSIVLNRSPTCVSSRRPLGSCREASTCLFLPTRCPRVIGKKCPSPSIGCDKLGRG